MGALTNFFFKETKNLLIQILLYLKMVTAIQPPVPEFPGSCRDYGHLMEKIGRLEEKVERLENGIEKVTADLCLKICSENLEKKTAWRQYSDGKQLFTKIDLSHCKFIEKPAITTSLGGSTSHWTTTGSSEPYSLTKDGFSLYIYRIETTEGTSLEHAYEWNYHISYIAVGKIC